ncbi:hypothetical protein PRIPAC_73081, partial [Pristionchus pacificus]|uniref:Uncharacterized protein n=1 Tax=Pristionchus pacificus TaxID=54126 RepID=A0A2A6C7C3_PRIPA
CAHLTLAECAEDDRPKTQIDLPPHLSLFVAHLKDEITATAEKYSEPRERATRILATYTRLLAQLPITDRRLLASRYDGNSLLDVADPHNYRSVVIQRHGSADPPHP